VLRAQNSFAGRADIAVDAAVGDDACRDNAAGDEKIDDRRQQQVPGNHSEAAPRRRHVGRSKFGALDNVLSGQRLCRIADLHGRTCQQVVYRLVAARGCQNHERVQAEQPFDDDASAGLQETDIAAIVLVNDAQVVEIMPERAADPGHENRLIQQQRNDHQNSERTRKIVASHGDYKQHRAIYHDQDDDPVEQHRAKPA
jgi:hypothetical protein